MPNPLLQNENQELLYVEVYSQYSAGSGIDITSGVISLDPYISASIDSKLASADFGTYSAGVAQDIAYVSANAGKTYSGIAPIVVNDTTISADNFDLIIGSGLAFENNTLYVSAQQGNPDVESLVQTNSGLWNDVSAYQIASGDYATTAQLDTASSYLSGQIDNKLDKSDIGFDNDNTYVTGISGKEISASIAYKSYSSTYSYLADNADNAMSAQTARFDDNGHSLSSTYSSLYDLSSFVNNSSGAWNEGKTYNGISPIYVNNTTNEISADSQDITFGTGLDFTNGVLSVTAQGGDPEVESVVKSNSADWGTITALSSTSAILSGAIDYVSGNAGTTYTGVAPIVVNGNTISADSFDLTIGSGLAFENNTLYVSAQGGNPEVEQVVQTYSAAGTWLINSDLSGYLTTGQYETDSAVFNAKQDALTFTTTTAISTASNYGFAPITGISGINGSPLIIPMKVIKYFDEFYFTNQSAINKIYNKRIAADLDGEGFSIKDYYQRVSGISATEWNSNYETVATNSGSWGGQSLPISAGSGVNITLVDNTLVFSNDYNKVVIDEIITAGYYRDGNSIYPILQKTVNIPFTATTAYNTNNVILNGSTTPWSGASIKWLDVGNSFMDYGGQARLATNYQLDANRIGNVVLLSNGSLSYRGKDNVSAPITGTFTVKWVEQ